MAVPSSTATNHTSCEAGCRQLNRFQPSNQKDASRHQLTKVRDVGTAPNYAVAAPKQKKRPAARRKKSATYLPVSEEQRATLALTSRSSPMMPGRLQNGTKRHKGKIQRLHAQSDVVNVHSAAPAACASSKDRKAPSPMSSRASSQMPGKYTASSRPSSQSSSRMLQKHKVSQPSEPLQKKNAVKNKQYSQDDAWTVSVAPVPAQCLEPVLQPVSMAPCESKSTHIPASVWSQYGPQLEQAVGALQELGSDPSRGSDARAQPPQSASMDMNHVHSLFSDHSDSKPQADLAAGHCAMPQQHITHRPAAPSVSQLHRSDQVYPVVSNLEQDFVSFVGQEPTAGWQPVADCRIPDAAPECDVRSAQSKLTDTSTIIAFSHTPSPARSSLAALHQSVAVPTDVRPSGTGRMQQGPEELSREMLFKGVAAAAQLGAVAAVKRHSASWMEHSMVSAMTEAACTSFPAHRAFEEGGLVAQQQKKQTMPLWEKSLIRSRSSSRECHDQDQPSRDQAVGAPQSPATAAPNQLSLHSRHLQQQHSKVEDWLGARHQTPVFSAQSVPAESMPSPLSTANSQISHAGTLASSHLDKHSCPKDLWTAAGGGRGDLSVGLCGMGSASASEHAHPERGRRSHHINMQNAAIQTTPSLLQFSTAQLATPSPVSAQTMPPPGQGCSLPNQPSDRRLEHHLVATAATKHAASDQGAVVSCSEPVRAAVQQGQMGRCLSGQQSIGQIAAELEHGIHKLRNLQGIVKRQQLAAGHGCELDGLSQLDSDIQQISLLDIAVQQPDNKLTPDIPQQYPLSLIHI